uniref:Uncharacterized protein n=1 Tax=Octopus bimaculoides TaxID=37653 RepID=A0A0L8IBX7_OCTBM
MFSYFHKQDGLNGAKYCFLLLSLTTRKTMVVNSKQAKVVTRRFFHFKWHTGLSIISYTYSIRYKNIAASYAVVLNDGKSTNVLLLST